MVAKDINEDNDMIDWSALESELEMQDHSAGNFYGDDDLSSDQVVSQAQANSK